MTTEKGCCVTVDQKTDLPDPGTLHVALGRSNHSQDRAMRNTKDFNLTLWDVKWWNSTMLALTNLSEGVGFDRCGAAA